MLKIVIKDVLGAAAVLALAAGMGNLGHSKTTTAQAKVPSVSAALQKNPSYAMMPTSQNLMVLMAAHTQVK